jgi:hypothetical protein
MHSPLRTSLPHRDCPILIRVVVLSVACRSERSQIRARRDKARGTASRACRQVGGRYRVLGVDVIVATAFGGIGSPGRGKACRSKGGNLISSSRKGTYAITLLVLHLALILGCGGGSGRCWTNAARIAANIAPRSHRWWRG